VDDGLEMGDPPLIESPGRASLAEVDAHTHHPGVGGTKKRGLKILRHFHDFDNARTDPKKARWGAAEPPPFSLSNPTLKRSRVLNAVGHISGDMGVP